MKVGGGRVEENDGEERRGEIGNGVDRDGEATLWFA